MKWKERWKLKASDFDIRERDTEREREREMGHSSLPGLEEKEEIEGDKRWDASPCVFFHV